MLRLTIPSVELWDESKEEFVHTKEYNLQLEHSLVSLSKWESKWCKPFLDKKEKTNEETIDYIRCMTLTQNIPADAYNYLTNENMEQVNRYIDAPMTATWFSDEKNSQQNNRSITAELIYYWMLTLNIPFECQKWHLNRLLTLIRVCNAENKPQQKRKGKDVAAQYAKINAARQKQWNTKG